MVNFKVEKWKSDKKNAGEKAKNAISDSQESLAILQEMLAILLLIFIEKLFFKLSLQLTHSILTAEHFLAIFCNFRLISFLEPECDCHIKVTSCST